MALGKQTALGVLAALALATAQADSGDADLRRAAKLHFAGETAQAVALWKGLAEKGNVDAAYNLAVIHYTGDNVARDYGEALKWYRLAAERGDRLSQYQLGLMYLRGEGVAADEAEAHRWFVMKRAEHQHHAHSPQMQQWRAQAAALLWQRDMRESLAATRRDGNQLVAELRRRAGLPPTEPPTALASASAAASSN